MNPWYLAAILGGGYALTKMSTASTSAAKTVAKATRGASGSSHTVLTASGFGLLPPQTEVVLINPTDNMGDTEFSNLKKTWPNIAKGDGVVAQWKDSNGNIVGSGMKKSFNTLTVIPKSILSSAPAGQDLHASFTQPQYERGNLVQAQFNLFVPAAAMTLYGQLHAEATGQTPPSGAKSASDLIKQAQDIVNSFPPDGSDASAYIAWTASTAFKVPGLISDIQNLINTLPSGSQDLQTLTTLVSQLAPLVVKAASNSGGSGGGNPLPPADGTTPTAPDGGGGY
jgi:hypothetical protein